MRTGLKIGLTLCIFTCLISCRLKTSNITAVKYFGPVNPHDSVTDKFTLMPLDSTQFFLKKFRRTSGVLIKGSRYIQVEYKNGKKLVLQLPARTAVARVVDKKFNLFTDKWYVIYDTLVPDQWMELIRRQRSK